MFVQNVFGSNAVDQHKIIDCINDVVYSIYSYIKYAKSEFNYIDSNVKQLCSNVLLHLELNLVQTFYQSFIEDSVIDQLLGPDLCLGPAANGITVLIYPKFKPI